MKPLYNIYLLFIRSGLKNDTSFSQVVSVEEQAALAALAEEHRTIPFVLPGFRNTPFYSAMLQKTEKYDAELLPDRCLHQAYRLSS